MTHHRQVPWAMKGAFSQRGGVRRGCFQGQFIGGKPECGVVVASHWLGCCWAWKNVLLPAGIYRVSRFLLDYAKETATSVHAWGPVPQFPWFILTSQWPLCKHSADHIFSLETPQHRPYVLTQWWRIKMSLLQSCWLLWNSFILLKAPPSSHIIITFKLVCVHTHTRSHGLTQNDSGLY